MCKSSSPQNKAPYPNIYDLHKDFPEYLEDIPEMFYGKSNRLQSRFLPKLIANQTNQRQLFFEGKGCSFPILHIDYHWVHTQLTQIIGDKDFILYPPNQTSYLYPDKTNHNHSQIDTIKPDYNKFPLFKNAKSLKITLKPGKILFIPSGWWHTTYIHNFNLTYAIDHVNTFNWNRFMDENCLVAQKHYPKFAWLIKVYKVIMGRLFSLKEKIFN